VLEQGIALYDFQTHQARAFQYGQDHGMTCLVVDACVLWVLGYPERALQRAREARTLAYQHTHLNNRAFVIAISLWVFEFRREMDLVRQGADALIALCTEQNFPCWLVSEG
jgi:hypothetical protein